MASGGCSSPSRSPERDGRRVKRVSADVDRWRCPQPAAPASPFSVRGAGQAGGMRSTPAGDLPPPASSRPVAGKPSGPRPPARPSRTPRSGSAAHSGSAARSGSASHAARSGPRLIRAQEPRVRVRVSTIAGLLSVIPRLMGFHPGRSLVIVGFGGPRGTIRVTFRYDLPDPPDPAAAADIAEHAAAVLSGQRIRKAVVIGYGDGVVVTPVAERAAAALRAAGIVPCDVLRVADGGYWSYLCGRPDCCPPEGTPFDALAHPAAAELAVAG